VSVAARVDAPSGTRTSNSTTGSTERDGGIAEPDEGCTLTTIKSAPNVFGHSEQPGHGQGM